MATDAKSHVPIGDYQYGFHDPTDEYVFTSRKGLDVEIVEHKTFAAVFLRQNRPHR